MENRSAERREHVARLRALSRTVYSSRQRRMLRDAIARAMSRRD